MEVVAKEDVGRAMYVVPCPHALAPIPSVLGKHQGAEGLGHAVAESPEDNLEVWVDMEEWNHVASRVPYDLREPGRVSHRWHLVVSGGTAWAGGKADLPVWARLQGQRWVQSAAEL